MTYFILKYLDVLNLLFIDFLFSVETKEKLSVYY